MANRGSFRKFKKRTRQFRLNSLRAYSNPSWLSSLPLVLRIPILVLLWLAVFPAAIIAAPVLIYAALTSPLSEPGDQPVSSGFAFFAFVLLLLFMAVSAGASLLGVFQHGELCFTPNRYAGLYCNTLHKTPILFCSSIVMFWIIFWVCVAGVISGVRVWAQGASRDA